MSSKEPENQKVVKTAGHQKSHKLLSCAPRVHSSTHAKRFFYKDHNSLADSKAQLESRFLFLNLSHNATESTQEKQQSKEMGDKKTTAKTVSINNRMQVSKIIPKSSKQALGEWQGMCTSGTRQEHSR